jgi:hypothetical protein
MGVARMLLHACKTGFDGLEWREGVYMTPNETRFSFVDDTSIHSPCSLLRCDVMHLSALEREFVVVCIGLRRFIHSDALITVRLQK